MDLTGLFAGIELLLGATMAGLGAWQYIVAAPLPGALGRSVRGGQKLEEYPPQRWQVSGGAMALFGVGFLMFGLALGLEGHLDAGALDAVRVMGLLAWVAGFGLVALLLTRFRRPS
jgi:hypothetical protein